MGQQEQELLKKYAETDPELKELLEDHVLFEKQLEKLEGKEFLTPQEQQTVKQLKKQKLDGKTRMYAILDEYRSKEN